MRKMFQDPHSKRIEFARSFTALWRDSGALCAIVGGSTAKLTADQYSDLEVAVYYRDLPEDHVRRQILKSINAIESFPFKSIKPADSQIEDNVTINDLRVDIIHCRIDMLNIWLNRMLVDHDPNLNIQSIAAALKSGESLFGSEHLIQLKERLKIYPEKLALEIFNQQFATIGVSQLQIAEYRGDRHMFYAILSSQHRRLLPILFAINRCFYPGEKNATKSTSCLNILAHANQVLNSLYDLPAKTAAEKFEQLVDEIVVECKRQFADLNIETLELRRRNARRPWP